MGRSEGLRHGSTPYVNLWESRPWGRLPPRGWPALFTRNSQGDPVQCGGIERFSIKLALQLIPPSRVFHTAESAPTYSMSLACGSMATDEMPIVLRFPIARQVLPGQSAKSGRQV